jgi:hypothetical protein
MFSVSVYLTPKIYDPLKQLVRSLMEKEKFGSACQFRRIEKTNNNKRIWSLSSMELKRRSDEKVQISFT